MTRRLTAAVRTVVLTLVMAPALLVAQEAQKQFVPVENLPKQEVAPGPLVYGAYALVWAAVVIYLFSLWRRLGRVERELADVNKKLAGHR